MLLPGALATLFVLGYNYYRKRYINCFSLFLRVWLLTYIFMVSKVFIYDHYLEMRMQPYKLADGLYQFSGSNEEDRKLSEIHLNSTGRNFAPITSIVFSLFYALGFYVLLSLWIFIKRYREKIQ